MKHSLKAILVLISLAIAQLIFAETTPDPLNRSATNYSSRITQATKDLVAKTLIGNLHTRQYFNTQVLDNRNITLNNGFISLHIFKGQKKLKNGIRTELVVDYPYKEGSIVTYEWEMMLPADFAADPKNRWWVMGQWHHQPDKRMGETKANLKSGSPPIQFKFEKIGNKYYLVPTYFYKRPPVEEMIEVELGRWIKLTTTILWSQSNRGTMKLYVDGKRHKTYVGQNMLNGYWHYLKVGMYRHPEIQTNNTINLRKLRITRHSSFVPIILNLL